MYCGGDDLGAIVADIGNHSTRIGFAGDDYPRTYIPSCLGIYSSQNSSTDMELESNNSKPLNYSFNQFLFHENMTIEYALQDGVISNWDHLEKLWEYSLASSIKVDIKETPVLLAEKSYNSSISRQKMCELMFEKFATPALFISKDAVLSCFACGKTTGVVVDCGGSGTVVTPITDGWADTTAISRSIIGGQYMDSHFHNTITHLVTSRYHRPMSKPSFYYSRSYDSQTSQNIFTINSTIQNIHPSFHSYMSLQMMRDFKETICRTAESSTSLSDNDPRYVNIPLVPYLLPDGTLVEIGGERFQTPELLFDPSKLQKPSEHLLALGLDSSSPGAIPSSTDSIDKLVLDSILRCEPSTQSNIVSTMIITGANSCYDGMPERIRTEVEKILYLNTPAWKMKMICSPAKERPVCSWLGGSILASLGSLHEMWMAKSEYDEYGAGLIDRKCP